MRLYKKAHIASKEGRIVRLIIGDFISPVYIFVGRKRDYIVSPNYCTCKYFLFKTILSRQTLTCYHILALREAMRNDKIRTISVSFEEYKNIIYEIYVTSFSVTLRQIINKSEKKVNINGIK